MNRNKWLEGVDRSFDMKALSRPSKLSKQYEGRAAIVEGGVGGDSSETASKKLHKRVEGDLKPDRKSVV